MPDITLVQTALDWEDPAANRSRFDTLLASVGATDLIVLPEMFSTGFSMASARLAEPPAGETFNWMADTARAHNAAVCGSLITSDCGKHFNRFYLVRPDGSHAQYDKRHLFRMGEENENYSAGNDRLTIDLGDARLFPQVCYDLRFPVFSRNDIGFDIMIYVANWPAPRREHWRTLLRARAIENLCYVVGVNRIGRDGNNVDHAGDSAVIDFRGDTMADLGDSTGCRTLHVDLDALREYREAFPAWKDADQFSLVDNNVSQRSS